MERAERDKTNQGHNKERTLLVFGDGKRKPKERSCTLVIGDENLMMSEAYIFRWLTHASSEV